MSISFRPFPLMLLVLLILPSCTKNADTDVTADTTGAATSPTAMTGPGIVQNDTQFVINTLIANKGEIALSTLAVSKAFSPAVKVFARTVVADHTAVYNELRAIAQQKNFTVPDTAGAADYAGVRQRLDTISGEIFDKEFIDIMVKHHERSRDAFQLQATGGSDSVIKAFAQKYLDPITQHLQRAREMDTVPYVVLPQ